MSLLKRAHAEKRSTNSAPLLKVLSMGFALIWPHIWCHCLYISLLRYSSPKVYISSCADNQRGSAWVPLLLIVQMLDECCVERDVCVMSNCMCVDVGAF